MSHRLDSYGFDCVGTSIGYMNSEPFETYGFEYRGMLREITSLRHTVKAPRD